MTPRRKKRLRRALWSLGALFVLLNGVAAMHAWRFTHFTDSTEPRRTGPQDYSFGQKLRMLFTGVDNPRPKSGPAPSRPYSRFKLKSDLSLDCWYLATNAAQPQGTVILFHGYGGEKSSLLGRAAIFLAQGYHVLLPDFRGSGGSEGSVTTIGYEEARDVAACYDFVLKGGEKKVVLFGVSMGAAALLKYMHETGRQPAAIIMECPYGTLYDAVCARFRMVGLPTIPMASLLTFWGGVELGFNGFSLQPQEYAKSVRCPALLIYGAKDDRVSRGETDAVFAALAGPKKLCVYADAGHANYLDAHRAEWTVDVAQFLAGLAP